MRVIKHNDVKSAVLELSGEIDYCAMKEIRQQIEDRFAHIGPPDDFIQKPFEMKALQEKLDRVISRPR